MMKKRFFLPMVLLICFSLPAETLSTLEEARNIADRAVELFSDQQYQEGVTLIKTYWAASPVTIDNLAAETRKQWSLIDRNYGRKLDTEFLRVSLAGESLVQFVHLVRFERYALKFQTTFYRNAEGWTIAGFTFDDKLETLFD